jgi:sulfur carrier protein ThiS
MKVCVLFSGKTKIVEMPKEAKAIDALRKMRVNPETVIIKRREEILLENETLKNNDRIELIKVVSGG